MEIGSRVYHEGVRANGVVVDIDDTMRKDKLKVEFFWAKYCDIPHGKWRGIRHPDRKWMMTRESELIETDWTPGPNRVSMVGNKSLERLIRNVAEVDRRRYNDGSDIVINYGGGVSNVPDNVFKINANPIWNKFKQCQIMDGLTPEITIDYPTDDEGWIKKPYRSIGGKGIDHMVDGFDPSTHYLQREFPKVREFRAHVFLWMDNQVPFIQEKVIADRDQLCWNKKQGGKFRYVYQEGLTKGKYMNHLDDDFREKISAISIEACKKLGYDFGGIDIGMDEEGNLTIFEVNSRMGLREQSLFTYKRAFQALRHLDIQTYEEERFNV